MCCRSTGRRSCKQFASTNLRSGPQRVTQKRSKRSGKPNTDPAWQPPDSSVDARYQSEQLKAFLLHRWVESTLEECKEAKSLGSAYDRDA